MGYQPIARTVPQYVETTGVPYSGAVLKAYEAGTTTVIPIATDGTGTTLASSVQLNASGFPELSGNVIIPHLDRAYKLALYPTQDAADTNTGALWMIDNLSVGLSFGETTGYLNADTILTQAAHANAHIEITGLTTLTLPPIASVADAMIFTYRNAGTEEVTFDANGLETINGQSVVTIRPGASGMFIAGSSSWSATGTQDVQSDFLNETLDNGLFETGDTIDSYRVSKTGWVLASGETIGSPSSGATERANSDTQDLFAYLWDNYPLQVVQDSSGVVTARGANALSDFDAGKRIVLPDERGRVTAGRDDMGGTAAGRLSLSRPEGVDGTFLGAVGGEQEHVQTEAELVAHGHSVTRPSRYGSGPTSSATNYFSSHDTNRGNATLTMDDTGGGEAMNNVQPTVVKNIFIKL